MTRSRRTMTSLCLGVLATMFAGTTAAWAGPGQDPTPATCAASPPGQACLVVTATSGPVREGRNVDVTFTMTNAGDTTATPDEDFLLHAPALGIDNVQVDGVPTRYSQGPGSELYTIDVEVAEIAPGADLTVTFVVHLDSDSGRRRCGPSPAARSPTISPSRYRHTTSASK